MYVKRVRTLVVCALLAGGIAVAGCSAAGAGAAGHPSGTQAVAPIALTRSTAVPVAAPRTITAQGVGQVTGTPDTATVVLGVQTSASSASAALAENSTKANAVIAMLKDKGVKPADLQTSQLSINPTYDRDTITGYQVTNQVTVTLHAIGDAGPIIDAAQGIAGNAIRVDQIGFSIGDGSALRAQARADAVKQAMAQAQQMAAAAGVALGPIVSISETPSTTYPVEPYAVPAAASGMAAPPIEAGSQQLSVTVQVVYAIG